MEIVIHFVCLFFFSSQRFLLKDMERFRPEVRLLQSLCKSKFRLSRIPTVDELIVQASTIPWSVLVFIGEARTPAREIQEVLWFVNTTAGSTLRVLCRGVTDVHLQGNMACTPEFVI